jgi:hypothetical protein
MLNRTFITVIFAWVAVVISGCSVYMAAQQPPKKNISLFSVGTPRDMLLAEFGMPSVSEMKEGRRRDIFTFKQGYSTATRTGRAVFHGVADIFTLGLWEVVGTPTELVFQGEEMAFDVSYDENDRIDKVTVLKKN